MRNIITISPAAYHEMQEHLHASGGVKKIAAIKAVRRPGGVGLKEAKEAVERIMHEANLGHFPGAAKNAARIVATAQIKEIVVDFGEGPFTVDIDTMELKALTQLEKIGLEQCGQILDLVEVLRAFSEGRRVGVLEDK